jgi:hypothetical protein
LVSAKTRFERHCGPGKLGRDEIGNRDNIARATLPIITESPSGESGLSNGTMFTVFESFTGKPVDIKYTGIINEQPLRGRHVEQQKNQKNPL